MRPLDDLPFAPPGPYTGQYRFSVQCPGVPLYMSDVRVNGARSPNGFAYIVGDAINEAALTVATDGGIIHGTVVDENGRPLSGVPTGGLMLPDPLPQQIGAYHDIYVQPDGTLTLLGIAPGTYQLIVWRNLPRGLFRDPALLRRSTVDATRIRIDPGGEMRVTVPVVDVR